MKVLQGSEQGCCGGWGAPGFTACSGTENSLVLAGRDGELGERVLFPILLLVLCVALSKRLFSRFQFPCRKETGNR